MSNDSPSQKSGDNEEEIFESPPEPEDHIGTEGREIWIRKEKEVLTEFLPKYKDLARKEKQPFLKQTVLPEIKKIWGARYMNIDRDKEKKMEWRVKKTVWFV